MDLTAAHAVVPSLADLTLAEALERAARRPNGGDQGRRRASS
jgi:hypothetical protein